MGLNTVKYVETAIHRAGFALAFPLFLYGVWNYAHSHRDRRLPILRGLWSFSEI